MGKILIEVDEIILGVTHSTYQLILKDVNSNRRLPIVIGVPEAQSIALAMEGKTLKRPNTHDLFYKLGNTYKITIKEIYIDRLEEGVFYSHIEFVQEGIYHTIDSRTSDAVALAIRFKAPMYIDERILLEAGVEIEKEEFDQPGRVGQEIEPPRPKSFQEELELMSLAELEKLLNDALSLEDYARAALIRDEISNRR